MDVGEGGLDGELSLRSSMTVQLRLNAIARKSETVNAIHIPVKPNMPGRIRRHGIKIRISDLEDYFVDCHMFYPLKINGLNYIPSTNGTLNFLCST